MKEQLTADDPVGWYLCHGTSNTVDMCGFWDGKGFCVNHINGETLTNFRRLYTENEVAKLKRELDRLKSQPYPMRRADKPDCVGLWKRLGTPVVNEITTLEGYFSTGPWYYLGPIPVIPAEQKPPQVVTVKCKRNGESCRAIPFGSTEYVLLDDNGVGFSHTSKENWEVVK